MENSKINKFVKDIKISEVIGNYLSIKKKGNNYICLCPFHDDKTPSLTINDQKGIFKCFACGESGNAISFISKYLKIPMSKAILECSKILDIDFKKIGLNEYLNNNLAENEKLYDINNFVLEIFKYYLNKNEKVKEYLSLRKINQEEITKFDIGYCPTDTNEFINFFKEKNKNISIKYLEELNIIKKINEGYNLFFADRIIFPIRNFDNDIVGFSGRRINDLIEPKYLNSPESKIFKKQDLLYNFNNLKKHSSNLSNIYILEGFMDVISCNKIGIENAIATMGVAFSKNHLNIIKENLNNIKVLSLFYDNDQAGRLAIDNTAKIIGNKMYIYVVDYGDIKYKDIDEIVNSDQELAKKVSKNIVDYSEYKIKKLLSNNDLNEPDKKITIFDECINLLNNHYNLLTIDTNIELMSNILNIDKQKIYSKIKIKNNTSSFKNKSINNNKVLFKFIDDNYFNVNISKSINKISNIENYILKYLIFSRKYFDIFISKIGIFKNKKNNEIFNSIEYFYNMNKSISSLININIEDLVKKNNINNDNISFFISLYDDARKQNYSDNDFEMALKNYSKILIDDEKNKLVSNNDDLDEKITKILDLNNKYKLDD